MGELDAMIRPLRDVVAAFAWAVAIPVAVALALLMLLGYAIARCRPDDGRHGGSP